MKKKPEIPKRILDGRYKPGVDTGAMSKQTITLPLKTDEQEKSSPKVFVPHYKKMRPDIYNPDGTPKKHKKKKKK